MIAVPAVDVKAGRCVQLVGGRPEAERISLPEPAAVARDWWDRGFSMLHVIDLDAALGSGSNVEEIADVLKASPAVKQVGGGVRDDARAHRLLSAGADRLIVGTRAVDDPDWLAALTRRYPGRVVVAADVRNGMVLRHGWTVASRTTVEEWFDRMAGLALAGILTTDVEREGKMEGIDRRAATWLLHRSEHPLWISGGVTSEDDLAWLADEGAAGAVLGMALYTGRLDADRVARRWGGHAHGRDER